VEAAPKCCNVSCLFAKHLFGAYRLRDTSHVSCSFRMPSRPASQLPAVRERESATADDCRSSAICGDSKKRSEKLECVKKADQRTRLAAKVQRRSSFAATRDEEKRGLHDPAREKEPTRKRIFTKADQATCAPFRLRSRPASQLSALMRTWALLLLKTLWKNSQRLSNERSNHLHPGTCHLD
jgi:hypothetical protein